MPQQWGNAGAGGLHQVFGFVQNRLACNPGAADLRHSEQQDTAHAVGQT